jgi:hypothetical protein
MAILRSLAGVKQSMGRKTVSVSAPTSARVLAGASAKEAENRALQPAFRTAQYPGNPERSAITDGSRCICRSDQ